MELRELRAMYQSVQASLSEASRSAELARVDEVRASRLLAEAQQTWRAREAELLLSVSELQTAVNLSSPAAEDPSASPRLSGAVQDQAMQRRRAAFDAERGLATERLERELAELRARHNTCLRLLGAKGQRIEELTLDLAEAREIYREQILALTADSLKRPGIGAVGSLNL